MSFKSHAVRLSTLSSVSVVVTFWCHPHGAVLFTLQFALTLNLTETRVLSGLSSLGPGESSGVVVRPNGGWGRRHVGGQEEASAGQQCGHLPCAGPGALQLHQPQAPSPRPAPGQPTLLAPLPAQVNRAGNSSIEDHPILRLQFADGAKLAPLGPNRERTCSGDDEATQDEHPGFSEPWLSSLYVSQGCLTVGPQFHSFTWSVSHFTDAY